jgi:hypothetical protein
MDEKNAKVLPFRKSETIDAESLRMLKVADEIDAVILNNINKDMDARDLAGLIAHRLGTLMRHIEAKDREVMWLIVQKVLREQADLEKAE